MVGKQLGFFMAYFLFSQFNIFSVVILADELSDLVIELSDYYSDFANSPGEFVCATTSGPATSDPYMITCNNMYYKRFLKIGRPNATNSEHFCVAEIEVYG